MLQTFDVHPYCCASEGYNGNCPRINEINAHPEISITRKLQEICQYLALLNAIRICSLQMKVRYQIIRNEFFKQKVNVELHLLFGKVNYQRRIQNLVKHLQWSFNDQNQCVQSVRIWSYSGQHFPAFGLNAGK